MFCKKFANLKPAYIGELLLPKLLEIKRKYNIDIELITVQQIESVLQQLNEQMISKEAVEEILAAFGQQKSVDFLRYKTLDTADIEKDIKKIVEQNKDKRFGAIMHIVMGKYRGKADGKLIAELIKKYVGNN